MVLGGGGERILYHTSAQALPKKHQLLLEFDDATYLTVSVQGWGSVHLIKPAEVHRCCGADKGLTPIDKGFTFDYFAARIAAIPPEDSRSVKFFVISQPGVKGVANGYLQDVLFRAKLHPRTPVARLSSAQRRSLYKSLLSTMKQAVQQHGRDDEHDLFDQPGRYHRILSADAAGKPCPNCKTRIVKESFLGGAVYFCPKCQPVPPLAARKTARKT
jgi:formamidopyrimidine-DNA glycosylase